MWLIFLFLFLFFFASPRFLTGFLHVSGREGGWVHRCHFALRCCVSLQMLCNRTGLPLAVKVIRCLSPFFPEWPARGSQTTAHIKCPHPDSNQHAFFWGGLLNASQRSAYYLTIVTWTSPVQWGPAGVFSCRRALPLFCEAQSGNNVSCAVCNFCSESRCCCWRAFFSLQQCRKLQLLTHNQHAVTLKLCWLFFLIFMHSLLVLGGRGGGS